jgi:hypothetical protein
MIFGGIALFIIAQLFLLSWAMFVAGRSGMLYVIQVVVIILLSLSCVAIVVLETPNVTWLHLIQVLLLLGTSYVIYHYHGNNP